MEVRTHFEVRPHVDGQTGARSHPVMRVVTKVEGKHTIETQAKIVAPSLTDFRDQYPRVEVRGAPTLDDIHQFARGLSDEELAAAGLRRVDPEVDIFASPQAAQVAQRIPGLEIAVLQKAFEAGMGEGQDGKLRAADVRAIHEELQRKPMRDLQAEVDRERAAAAQEDEGDDTSDEE